VAAKKSAKRKTVKSAVKKPAGKTKTVKAKKAVTKKIAARPVSKKTASPPAAKKPAAKPPVKKPVEKAAAPRVDAPPPVPNAMGLLSYHSDYTTHNFEEVRRFYTQQLGFSRFSYDANWRYMWIQTSNQSSIGFMPPMRGLEPLPPREPTIYFMVRDIEEAYRKLQARGVSFEDEPQTMPWGHRLVRTRDPEGRSIVLAQDMTKKEEA
jgi:predicted enzyme related to lactoylglutathione lyase